MIRQDTETHNWGWGRRYVKLSFKQRGNQLIVRAPALPGLAVPGYYMLFVLSEEGVPSVAKVVHLSENRGDDDDDDEDHDDDDDDRDEHDD